ncbi:MAG: ABC transporter permease [Firmicutes bacterium]|nr:ABC transporter permease [Bacillota bacterium]
METIKLYWTYIRLFYKSRSEYQSSFFAGMFANFFGLFLWYTSFWLITKKFHTIGSWDFDELNLLFSLTTLTFAISGVIYWYSMFSLGTKITTGELDRYLLRPIGILPQLVCNNFGYTFVAQFPIVLLFLCFCLVKLSARFTVLSWLYLIYATFGSIMLQCGMNIIVGALSFWLLRSSEIGQIVLFDTRWATHYPINIYPRIFQIILSTIIPWAFANYYPCVLVLDKAKNNLETFLGLIAPVVGILVFWGALILFKIGLKRYTSVGN